METLIKVAITYAFVTAGLRIAGKRTFGQLSPADLVLLMLIPEFYQQAIAGEDSSMTNALLATSTLLLIATITETLAYRFPMIGNMVNGKPSTVISRSQYQIDRMHKERLGPDEIIDAVHKAGLERIEQVKWAVLYPDGTVAVVPWEAPQPGRQIETQHEV